jgi:hypothetical protein
MAVGELAGQLPVSRPAVSQHLKVLKEVGVVADSANGTRRVYRVDPGAVDALRVYLDQLWDMPVVVAEHPRQVRRQRLHPLGDPVGLLGQPRRLGPQPDDAKHGHGEPGQPGGHQYQRGRLHDVGLWQ